jgi:hypothetical protein
MLYFLFVFTFGAIAGVILIGLLLLKLLEVSSAAANGARWVNAIFVIVG